MRALVREWGKMVFKEDYDKPKVGSENVLIRIKAAAINPVDYKAPKIILGSVVGLDFAGVIESIGKNVTDFAVGDEVYGKVNGSLADYAVADTKVIALKPKNLSFTDAAAIPLTYLTSLQALRDGGSLMQGGRVLIIGASGGCGIAAIQLARSMGAKTVVAVCSGKNEELVKSHGADEVIDYRKHDVVKYFQNESSVDIPDSLKFDVIYDAATASGGGEDYRSKSIQLLCEEGPSRAHGQYVAINGGPDFWLRHFTIGQKKNQHLIITNNNNTDLNHLSKLADDGWRTEDGEKRCLSPVLDSLLPFTSENVQNGFELLKSRRAAGKIVFNLSIEE